MRSRASELWCDTCVRKVVHHFRRQWCFFFLSLSLCECLFICVVSHATDSWLNYYFYLQFSIQQIRFKALVLFYLMRSKRNHECENGLAFESIILKRQALYFALMNPIYFSVNIFPIFLSISLSLIPVPVLSFILDHVRSAALLKSMINLCKCWSIVWQFWSIMKNWNKPQW